MITLETIERFEQEACQKTVQDLRSPDSLDERVASWVHFFRDTQGQLKKRLASARGKEREQIREQMKIVARSCDLFMTGLTIAVTNELPHAVSKIIREEFPTRSGEIFATTLTDVEPDGEKTADEMIAFSLDGDTIHLPDGATIKLT